MPRDSGVTFSIGPPAQNRSLDCRVVGHRLVTFWMRGTRVELPTSNTSWMSLWIILASCSTLVTGSSTASLQILVHRGQRRRPQLVHAEEGVQNHLRLVEQPLVARVVESGQPSLSRSVVLPMPSTYLEQYWWLRPRLSALVLVIHDVSDGRNDRWQIDSTPHVIRVVQQGWSAEDEVK